MHIVAIVSTTQGVDYVLQTFSIWAGIINFVVCIDHSATIHFADRKNAGAKCYSRKCFRIIFFLKILKKKEIEYE